MSSAALRASADDNSSWSAPARDANPSVKTLAVRAATAGFGWPVTTGRADLVSAQYVGLTATRAEVLVQLTQTTRKGPSLVSANITVSVALATDSTKDWQVVHVSRPDGSCVSAHTSALGHSALDDPALDFPEVSREDIVCGRVGEQLLDLLTQLGKHHRLQISVLKTGHPDHVFGQTYVSNHTGGRGVDIWAIDGIPVLDPLSEQAVRDVAVRARDLGATEIGTPWDFDGAATVGFANALHRDHLHLAFDGLPK